jgi:hypothetical protein
VRDLESCDLVGELRDQERRRLVREMPQEKRDRLDGTSPEVGRAVAWWCPPNYRNYQTANTGDCGRESSEKNSVEDHGLAGCGRYFTRHRTRLALIRWNVPAIVRVKNVTAPMKK